MPKRTKPDIGPGKVLVNGGRVAEDESGPVTLLQRVDLDIASIREIRKKVAAYIGNFDELTQLEDRDRLVQDLVDECAWARALRLDLLTNGTRTKPNEWTAQILASGLAKVMRQHRLTVVISEYFDRHHEWRQSLYLRLIPGLVKIAGFPVPKYVKGLALRAKRINHEGVIRTQIKRRRRSRPIQVVERFPSKKPPQNF
jgi:hypothetical protein